MQPVLLQLGPVTFYSFGVFAALAFAAGGYVIWYLAKRDKLPLRHLLDYALYTSVAALIGARLWYLVFRADEVTSFWQWFTVGGGGLALPGGLLLGGIVLVLAIRRNGEPIRPWLDIAAVGTAAGLAVGKFGSFLNGDGFGSVSSLPWAVEISDPLAPASVATGALHPVQLYGMVLYAVLAFGLWKLHERVRKRQGWRPGAVCWAGLLGVSVIQVILEPFHSPLDALVFGTDVRVIYLVALVLGLISAVMLYRSKGRVA